MKLITTTILILLVWCSQVFAGEVRQIELNDGSVISGEIIAFANGVYTIHSTSLGTIEIEDSKIKTIRSPSAEPAPKTTPTNPSLIPPTATSSNLQALQGMIMSNPQTLESVMSLQDDPDFQAIMQDPEVMSAVMSGNINVLLTNPKFMKLLEHPQVKEIQTELGE
jgi:hypothetical protein